MQNRQTGMAGLLLAYAVAQNVAWADEAVFELGRMTVTPQRIQESAVAEGVACLP